MGGEREEKRYEANKRGGRRRRIRRRRRRTRMREKEANVVEETDKRNWSKE